MKYIASFSGGETSALMSIKLKEKYPDTVFVYANTGEENEETLIFVDKVDKAYNLGVVWIEAVINPEKGKGTTYKIVNFETASRKGEPFEEMIKVYGLPSPSYIHCTRELKLVPINKYIADLGGDFQCAVGIRSDEIDRVNPNYKEKNLCYPLAFWWPTTKNEVNTFWRDQPFRLNLKHYEGNCKWCYKKSLSKLSYIFFEHPEHFDFPERMEAEHGTTNREYGTEPIRIFRGHRTVADIRKMSLTATEPVDDARRYEVNGDLFGYDDMDVDICGSESCEAFLLPQSAPLILHIRQR